MLPINRSYLNGSARWGTYNAPKYIVVHYTGNKNKDTALNNVKYISGLGSDAPGSAHYYIDDNECYQLLEDNWDSWSVGDDNGYGRFAFGITNTNQISIEMCCTDGEYRISQKTRENCAELVAYLLKKHGLGLDKVKRHYDASRKDCPSGWNNGYTEVQRYAKGQGGESTFIAFKELVKKAYNGEKVEGEKKELIGGIYDMAGKINMRVKYKDNGVDVWTKWYNMDEGVCDPYKNIAAIEIYANPVLKFAVLIGDKWIEYNGNGVIDGGDNFIKGIKAKVSDNSKKVYYWVSSPGDTVGYEWWNNSCKTNYGEAICQNSKGTTPLNAIKIRLG